MSRIDEYGVLLLAPEEETVPESSQHEQTVDLLLAGLRARYARNEQIQVFGRLAWFPDKDNTRVRLDPDVMVVRGRPPGPRKSYRAWAENYVSPALIMEVVSEDDTDAGYRQRLGRARNYGVVDVLLISPFAPGGVRVEHLRSDPGDDHVFRTVAVSTDASRPLRVPVVDLLMAGGDTLQVIDERGVWPEPADAINLFREEAARADREAARADQEAARADQEAARAEQEAARADQEAARAEQHAARAEQEAGRVQRLAAQLRDAGIDPEV